MARGRQRAEWERTALLAAISASPYRDPAKHKEPFQPWEFNPFADRRPPQIEKQKIKISVECLKGLFAKQEQRHGGRRD